MAELQLSTPNTCAVIDLGFAPTPEATPVVYIPENTGYNAKIGVPDTYSSFQEFTNPQDALAAALAIDPSYPANNILGPLTLDPVNVSDPDQTAYIGTDLTLNCEFECTDPTATVTYSWTGPTGDLGVTEPSLEIDSLTEAYAGAYTCSVASTNSAGQTGRTEKVFSLTVTPAPNPSGVIFTGRSGASTLDLAPSYFPTLNNMPAGVDESGLELYVPGTDTVISYNDELPAPFRFDSTGNCFAPGDFRLVVRVAATSQVLATVYPPSGANQNILWLYNPVVPDAPAGSGGGGAAVPV